MKKICKKLLIILTTLALSVSALLFGGCTYPADGLEGDYQSGAVTSQGGWVVQKGEYIYFINGVVSPKKESAGVDEEGNEVLVDVPFENEYGDAVKGALMRIKASDLTGASYGESKAEVVVPLLLTSSDYTAGVFIYGDYAYYATPTTAKNLEGQLEGNYIDFKRTRLDGKETMRDYYFRAEDDKTKFRFVEVDGVVYCLHVTDNNIYSYNTETKKDTLLVKNAASYVFHKNDLGDPYVYYTMSVTQDIDKENSVAEGYTQVYRVRADATYELNSGEASYTVTDGTGAYEYSYDFDKKSLENIAKHEDHEGHEDHEFKAGDINTYPYVNLGQLVLDGLGRNSEMSQYNHAEGTPYAPDGYKYTLISYENDGLYYRRQQVAASDSTGESGWTFYLAESNYAASDWNAVTGNANTAASDFGGANDVIAVIPDNVSASTLFYIKNGVHYYLYSNGTDIVRVKVAKDGSREQELIVAKSVSALLLMGLDNESSDTYKYVYYKMTSGGIGRAVYDSTESGYAGNEEVYYNNIIGTDEYKPVSILNVNHPTVWYAPEIIGGNIFFADSTVVGSELSNLAHVISLETSDGEVMDNKEIKEYNEKLKNVQNALSNATKFSSKTGNAVFYYYSTGDKELFQTVIDEAVEEGKGEYSIFSEKEQAYFDAYVNKKSFSEGKISEDFSKLLVAEDGTYYGLRSYFYHVIGVLSEEEQEILNEDWRGTYLSKPIIEDVEEGLPTWAWVLIGIAIGVGVVGVGCGVAALVVLRRRKNNSAEQENAPKRKKYAVDMAYDENIDVYATEETPAEETPAEESAPEAPVEEVAEETPEAPVEEPKTEE
ncbi:MAG: hypothetical protein IJY26_02310 [Clostridia bacterium]|nr:hypothetical protein [Clostridia bacterium]